ncbi:MAG: hypothetical protein JWM32_524 [Verrucomicrobia bacterium]|nr:hypothetical protein [Verrucomicrobiota bacterium]
MAVEGGVAAPLENGANVWSDEAAESAFLAEQRDSGTPAPPSAVAEASEEVDSKNALPSLDELVKRISPGTRELMDELFRAKFIAVRRVPKKALKEK